MDLGNVCHSALELFSKKASEAGGWTILTEEQRKELIDECVEAAITDYGNSVLYSSARNEQLIVRMKQMLERTVWALTNQLKAGDFVPEAYELRFFGGKIDRVDVCETEEQVYVKVMDYKTGSKAFDIVALYHGLQLQLMIYMDAAIEFQKKRHPEKEVVPAGVFYYRIQDPIVDKTKDKEEAERQIQQHDTIYTLQKTAVSPRAAKPKLKSREKIFKQVQDALISGMTPQQRSAEKKYTTFLYDRPMERNLVNNNSGLYVPNDTGTHPIQFGKIATISQIRDGLKSIDAVLKGYQQYVVDYNDDYGKRFYEAILYSFTAPFLWEIRAKASLNPEDGNDIPNFLILGATAGSGKSTLLRIINQLTWNTDRSLIDFGTIYPTDTPQKKAKTVDAIEHYMKLGSSYPVLMDEIEPYFFQQDQYSRHLVVDTMNELVNNPHAIAPLIGTTNYDSGFTMLRETARRTYYLQIDKVIDDQQKGEANKYIYNVRQTLNNTLFKDFVMRMASLLEDDETPWRAFDEKTGKLDFLANTRKIFRDYYQMADMEVPPYFADEICDDFKESSRNRWAKLYLTQEEDFKYRQQDHSLLFDISKLNTFNGFTADSIEKYRNALPIELCVDGINGKRGKFVEIKADEFFKWIGERNPYAEDTAENEAKNEEILTVNTAEEVTESPVKEQKKGFWARLFG